MTEKTEKAAHIWARDALDWYVEDQRVTRQLLGVERFVGAIYDPCCGMGNIVQACRDAGYIALGSDIKRRVRSDADWFLGEKDFLQDDFLVYAPNFLMNPPYFGGAGTEAFIRRALGVATGKVCVFVDRRFLTGKRRAAGLYTEHPPTRVWEITPRPSCPPGEYLEAGNKAGGGTADYAWLVWDLTAPSGATALGWLKG